MYEAKWDADTGGLILTPDLLPDNIRIEIRPVFFEELDLLELNRKWSYPKTHAPLLWATSGRRYFYRGRLVAETRGGGFFEKPEVIVYEDNLELTPVDTASMAQKNANLMEGLEQKAIEFIYNTRKKYSKKVDVTAVAFSGGKDSLVLLDLVQRALAPDEFVVVFADTTMELSPTYEAVEKAKLRWPNLNFHTARCHKDARTTWKEFGPPSRILRWCCTVHKSAPTLKLLRDISKKSAVKALILDGIRASESVNRAKYRMIQKGTKHGAQTNASPILAWNAAEIYGYVFERRLMMNNAYRYGLNRVGCSICPFSSQWSGYVMQEKLGSEFEDFLHILNEYGESSCVGNHDKISFLNKGPWRERAGGRGLTKGGNRVIERSNNGTYEFIISGNIGDWAKWAKSLGSVEWAGSEKGWICHDGYMDEFHIRQTGNGGILQFKPQNGANTDYLNKLRNLSNKTAYCLQCGVCEIECPSGALSLNAGIDIDVETCIHCGACINFCEKGCLVAKSLSVTQEGANTMKGVNRYQGFGMKKEWLDRFFRDPDSWWVEHGIGNIQAESMRVWLRESEIVLKNEITELGQKLLIRGVNDPLVWAVIWTNLSKNSRLIQWYTEEVPWGAEMSSKEMVGLLDDKMAQRTRANAITALFYLLDGSPLGNFGLGKIEKEKNQRVLKKTGWFDVPELAILYSLYKFAEFRSDHNLTISQLIEDSSRGPIPLFGMGREYLIRSARSLASNHPKVISINILKDLENIQLDSSYSSTDIAGLEG